MAVPLIEVRRHLALAHAINYCVELERHALPRKKSPPSGWTTTALKPYLLGKKRFGAKIVQELRLQFPRALVAHDSDVWSFLDLERTEFWLRVQLHSRCMVGIREFATTDLLTELANGSWLPGGEDLDAIAVLLCATRLARAMNKSEVATDLALRLARHLLRLSCCPMRAEAAHEIWRCCDLHFVRGLKRSGSFLHFGENTWTLFSEHIMRLRVKFLLAAYGNPEGTELPAAVMPELLREMIDAFATSDHSRTESFLRYFPFMAGRVGKRLDAEDVGLWREKPGRIDLGVLEWR